MHANGALLPAEIDTNYVRDERGRLLHDNVASCPPAPLALVAMPIDRVRFVEYGAQLDDETPEAIGRIVREASGDVTDRIRRQLGSDVAISVSSDAHSCSVSRSTLSEVFPTALQL